MYNHEHQYRCTIIRGKSQKDMDNLLPAYAKVINDITPCEYDAFREGFNKQINPYLSEVVTEKALANHRTEVAGKLFGMYWKGDDGIVYPSQRTQKFLEDNDQPAFFKDICFKMQFPNGEDSEATTKDKVAHHVSLRPCCYVLKCLLAAKDVGIMLSVREVGYYILNSLDVLQGLAEPEEVIEQIVSDRKNHIKRQIFDPAQPDKAESYLTQHIREQINYLEIANLVVVTSNSDISLNLKEMPAILLFASKYNAAPDFDVYSYDLQKPGEFSKMQVAWSKYFGMLSPDFAKFTTSVDSLGAPETPDDNALKGAGDFDKNALGDEGEAFVLDYEKDRVSKFDPRLLNKIKYYGKERGLGFDLLSVMAELGHDSEYERFIEVKSTKRVTPPVIDEHWLDSINITRNEWVAADQHRNYFYFYRVIFCKGKTVLLFIRNPIQKDLDGKCVITPLTYKVDFSQNSIDKQQTFNEDHYAV